MKRNNLYDLEKKKKIEKKLLYLYNLQSYIDYKTKNFLTYYPNLFKIIKI